MANNIKPEISLGVKGPQVMSLGDLLGTATKAMEYSRLSELYPTLIEKTQTELASAKLKYQTDATNEVLKNLSAVINHPILLKLEEDPNSVPQEKVTEFLTQYGTKQAKLSGVPEKNVKEVMNEYFQIAENNPGQLRTFFKARYLKGLDEAAKAQILSSGNPLGLSTVPANQPPFRGAVRPGVTAEDMTAPIGARQEVAPVAPPQTEVSPIQMGQADPQARGAGFSLPYEPPRAGVPRAALPSEATDLAAGQKYRADLITGQGTVPKAMRNVDAVLSSIKEIEKDRRFTTGPLEARERYIRQFLGDERFTQLSKDIANVELAVLQASGGSMSTDAGKSLVAKANGDETYPPSVLLSVAKRLAGDLTRLDMEAQGAQKFAQQFGDSNLPAYRQAWAANADQKIFEAMFINKNERDPKRRQESLDKILPKSREELTDFLTKYENIKRLSETGRLQ